MPELREGKCMAAPMQLVCKGAESTLEHPTGHLTFLECEGCMTYAALSKA